MNLSSVINIGTEDAAKSLYRSVWLFGYFLAIRDRKIHCNLVAAGLFRVLGDRALARRTRTSLETFGRIAKTESQAKFGKETVAGAHRRPKWVPHFIVYTLTQGVLRILRLC